MNEYENILKEIKELEDKLCPPPAQVSEIDHLKAKMRFLFENVIYERLYDISKFLDYHNKPKEEQTKSEDEYNKLKEEATKAKDYLFELADNEDEIDPWDASEYVNKSMVHLKNGLDDMHGGDCTAFACTCQRCYTESVYKLPHTATWGKHEGHKLYYRLDKLREQKKIIELANKLENELAAPPDSSGQGRLKI